MEPIDNDGRWPDISNKSIYDMKTLDGKSLDIQPLYSITATDKDSVYIKTIDFNREENEVRFFEKEVILDRIPVEIKNKNSISEHLNKEFIKIIEEEGDRNRENTPKYDNSEYKLDIDCPWSPIQNSSIVDENDIRKWLISKIMQLIYWVASDGRIGACEYLITNKKTNELLLYILDDTLKLTMIVDDRIEDDKIIFGRKNSFSHGQQGIILFLNENSLKEDVYNKNGKTYINLNYKFEKIGFYPDKQYLTSHIKNKLILCQNQD